MSGNSQSALLHTLTDCYANVSTFLKDILFPEDKKAALVKTKLSPRDESLEEDSSTKEPHEFCQVKLRKTGIDLDLAFPDNSQVESRNTSPKSPSTPVATEGPTNISAAESCSDSDSASDPSRPTTANCYAASPDKLHDILKPEISPTSSPKKTGETDETGSDIDITPTDKGITKHHSEVNDQESTSAFKSADEELEGSCQEPMQSQSKTSFNVGLASCESRSLSKYQALPICNEVLQQQSCSAKQIKYAAYSNTVSSPFPTTELSNNHSTTASYGWDVPQPPVVQPLIAPITEALKQNLDKSPTRFVAPFYTAEHKHINSLQSPMPNWGVIQLSLRNVASKAKLVAGEKLLKDTIREYTKVSNDVCNFGVLHDYEIGSLLSRLLPSIAEHALDLPRLLRRKIPFLKRGEPRTLYLTRNLACSLVAHAMLCTIIPTNAMEDLHCDFNFLKLYDETAEVQKTGIKKQKLRCFLEYFDLIKEMREDDGHSIISFERKCVKTRMDWSTCHKQLCDVKLVTGGGIEEADGMLQADFANKRIGGGVLGSGCVQEEIRFCISPELLCAMLFAEELSHDEVLVTTGTKIFSSYSGYGSTFRFNRLSHNPWAHDTKRDPFNREYNQVVAMDAWNFKPADKLKQYSKDKIDRDLHKSYVAFLQGHHKKAVATGNWGCGYFNGDVELKFLMQWMAASVNERTEMMYFAGDKETAARLLKIQNLIKTNAINVSTIYSIICSYEGHALKGIGQQPTCTVLEYVQHAVKKKTGMSKFF